jgi:hypothetical protein
MPYRLVGQMAVNVSEEHAASVFKLDIFIWNVCVQGSQIPFPTRALDFFNWRNPSSRTNGPGVDSAFIRNEYQESSGGKGGPTRKAENLTVICEPIV